jgi:hypothetical protein
MVLLAAAGLICGNLAAQTGQVYELYAPGSGPLRMLGGYPPAGVYLTAAADTAPSAWQRPAPRPMTPHEELSVNGLDLSLNGISALHSLLPAWNGQDIPVSIRERAFDTTDIDFRGRLYPSPSRAAVQSLHALSMATAIGGAGNTSYRGRGAARGALLASSGYGDLFPEPDSLLRSIRVQNHAYGTFIDNRYSVYARAYDVQSLRLPALLHVASAGNSGDSTSGEGPYAGLPGYAVLSASFKQAKHLLVVGGTDSLGRPEARSARGPAYDGRVKPDLAAFGRGGTSEAAALVSGTAAVLQQIASAQGGPPASSALLRALLIGSVQDPGAPGPDYARGFGNLDALAAARTLLAGQWRTDSIATGAVWQLPLEVPPGQRLLQVSLVWNDPAAAPDAARALVHDLDLRLLPGGAGPVLPWTLSAAPHPDSLAEQARRSRDSLNTVEFLSLAGPAPGSYLLEVSARQMGAGLQPFALAWAWQAADTLEWRYPLPSDPLLPGEACLLRWAQGFAPGTAGRLEYRLDGGPWVLIDAAVPLDRHAYPWRLPAQAGALELRMQAGGQTFASAGLTVAEALRLRTGFNCPDSSLVHWNPADDAAGYRIFRLGAYTLEPWQDVTDTVLIIRGADLAQISHLAVAPLAQGLTQPAGFTLAYQENQGVGCYFKSFIVSYLAQDTAIFTLQIGSVYGVSGIRLERETGSGWASVLALEPQPGQLEYTLRAPGLRQGLNRFRVRLELEGNRSLALEAEAVYYLPDSPWLVYPNPAAAGTPVQLLSRELGEAHWELYGPDGRRCAKAPIGMSPQLLPVDGLPPGLYAWRISDPLTGTAQTGKLLLH